MLIWMEKNVPWHILAPSAVACDMFLLRASAHPAERFYVIGRSYDIKKPDLLIGKSGSIIRVASCQGKCNRLCLRRRFPV